MGRQFDLPVWRSSVRDDVSRRTVFAALGRLRYFSQPESFNLRSRTIGGKKPTATGNAAPGDLQTEVVSETIRSAAASRSWSLLLNDS